MQVFIDSASSIPVIAGAVYIKGNLLPLSSLCDAANPLVLNSTKAVEKHFDGSAPLTTDQVNTYLASSTLLHSIDGWIYLSHAVEGMLKGDQGISIHLGYYAELRATMSFLAAEGIGIFNAEHLCVNHTNGIIPDPKPLNAYGNPIRSGTHKFAWEAIEKWANSNVKPTSNDILKVFSVNEKTFEEWADAFPFPSPVGAKIIIQRWLKKWSFDVNFFKSDRNMRNQVSYRPQRLRVTPHRHTLNEVIDKLSSYWSLIEPDSSNRFHALDKHLLRMFLQEQYNSLSTPIRNANSLRDVVENTISRLGLTPNASFVDFLVDTASPPHNLFVEAANHAIDPGTGSLNALSVIARAMLMLRISTGNASLVYFKAGVAKTELNFLWENIGTENGFWPQGAQPATFDLLWDDIKDYIEEVVQWADSEKPDLCLSKVYSNVTIPIPIAFNYFKQFHRAGLWGLYK